MANDQVVCRNGAAVGVGDRLCSEQSPFAGGPVIVAITSDKVILHFSLDRTVGVLRSQWGETFWIPKVSKTPAPEKPTT